ncbi:MAG: hypothetical protein GY838_18395 [bacterium]|nr:hypothetical protein [bacterium]
MKKLFFAMFALAALSLLAPSSGVADNNQIGIYTTSTPVPNSADARYDGALPGQFTCYIVCTNPWNNVTAGVDAAIVQLGGFEFQVILPPDFLIIGTTYPPNVLNLNSPPTFYCAGAIDVVDSRVLLVTLTLATFSGTSGLMYLDAVPTAPSIPGSLAITDAGNAFELIEAYPASGDLAEPVFGIAMDVVPSEDASWSELKALYQ